MDLIELDNSGWKFIGIIDGVTLVRYDSGSSTSGSQAIFGYNPSNDTFYSIASLPSTGASVGSAAMIGRNVYMGTSHSDVTIFNYDNQTVGYGRTGGGIFFHLSQLLFSNSLLVFCIFIIFVYIVFVYELINLNNTIIFFILIVYNAQYSIYHKYFDPLLYFILLFLIDFNNKKIQINFKNLSYKYTLLYLSFLFISFFKSSIIN